MESQEGKEININVLVDVPKGKLWTGNERGMYFSIHIALWRCPVDRALNSRLMHCQWCHAFLAF